MTRLDTSAFIGKFVDEARDRLKGLSAEILRLEQAAGTDKTVTDTAVGEILRQAHSLKGSALMLGLTDISHLAHQLEELFIAAKREPQLLDGRAFDLLLGALDLLSDRIDRLGRGDANPIELPICTRKCRHSSCRRKRQPVIRRWRLLRPGKAATDTL